ncbi:VOC family protein [Haliangium sp.]|uniref:VOC family protein n=1 Tax=Haliangium sp. TaxID=2663208 RepID=UPI003D0BC2E5
MSTAPPIGSFSHITLPVHDLGAAEAFYVDLLGATLVHKFDRETFLRLRPDRAHEVDADNSPLHLSITFGDTPEVHLFLQRNRRARVPVPHPHLAMNVDVESLDVFVARLQRAGVPIDGPRRLGPPGQASVYFADPSGNTLELTTMDYAGEVSDGPPDVSTLGW